MRSTSAALVLAALTACGRSGSTTDQPRAASAPARAALRVCADPNNLPFSNQRAQGFENALAELIAGDLGVPVRYTWLPQRRGFIRHTLDAEACDVVMGEPVGFDLARVTRPYYRSSYVFVTRADRGLADLRSLDDPRLRTAAIPAPSPS